MALSIIQKFKIKEGYHLLTIHAPIDFEEKIGKLPIGVTITDKGKNYQQIHWFVKNKARLEKEVNKIISLLKEDIICWIYYPKRSSTIQTDLTRDKGWDALLKHANLQWISLVSFDETWSAFGMRMQTEKDKQKKTETTQREIFNWVNTTTKEVTLPADVAALLKKHKQESAYFNTLSFTCKKEYIEWIVTAKKAATRESRLEKMIEMLQQKRKNPANR